MPFIDTNVIDDAIGAPTRNKITGEQVAVLNRLIAAADVRAQQDLLHAGYALDPETATVANTPIVVQHCSIGYFLKMGLPRVGLPVSAHYDVYTLVGKAIRDGETTPEGLTPNARDAIGGVSFTESDVDVDGSTSSVFSRDDLSSW